MGKYDRELEMLDRAARGELGAKGLRHVPKVAPSDEKPRRTGRLYLTESGRKKAAGETREALSALASGADLYLRSPKTLSGRILNRVSIPLDVARDIVNQAVEGGLAERRKRGGKIDWNAETAGILRGLFSSKPWANAKRTLLKGTPGNDLDVFRNLARSDPEWGKVLKKIPGGANTLDVISEIGVDALAAKAQSKIIKSVALPALRALGRTAEAVPVIGRAAEKGRAFQRAANVVGVEEARVGMIGRKAAAALEESRRTGNALQKRGVKLRVKNPSTGGPMNALGKSEADLLEAGSFGARHEPRLPKGQAPGEVYQRQMKQLPKLKGKLPERERLARKALAERAVASHARGITEQAHQGAKATSQTVKGFHAQAEQLAAQKARTATQRIKESERLSAAATNREQIAGSLRAGQKAKDAAARKLESAIGPLENSVDAANTARDRAEESLRRIRRNAAGLSPDELRASVRDAESAHRRLVHQAETATRDLDRAQQKAKNARRAVPSDAALTRADNEAAALRAKSAQAGTVAQTAQAEARAAAGQRRGLTNVVRQAASEEGKAAQRLSSVTAMERQAKNRAVGATNRYATTQTNVRRLEHETSRPKQLSDQLARRQQQVPIIQQEAQAAGIPWGDLTRTTAKYREVLDEVGTGLVDVGLLSDDAFQRLKRSYLPRLYEVSARSPKEAQQVLQRWVRAGVITPEVAAELGHASDQRNWKGLFRGSQYKPRELMTFEERNLLSAGRAAQPEAGPAVANYVARATPAIAERRALRVLAQDPNLAVPESALAQGTRPEWLSRATPVDISLTPGAAPERVFLHPGVGQYFAQRQWMEELARATPKAWKDLNQTLRKAWVSAPPTAVNNAVGNYALGHSVASMNGASYDLPGYLQTVSDIRKWRKEGKTGNRFLQEAEANTDLLNTRSSFIPPEARRVGGGFGVETPLQRAGQLPGQMFNAYRDVAYGDIEQAGRIYLFQQLRKAGMPLERAATTARDAMVDYANVSPTLHLLETNNILPFATFPLKSAKTVAQTAINRPDLFYTYSGERARRVSDRMADEKATAAGKKPFAAERRQQGLYDPFEFPIPGRFDELGQPVSVRAPFLAPFASALMSGPGGDIADSIKGRVANAFPLVNSATSIARNQRYNPYTGEYTPIVPPGSIPPGGTMGGPLGNLELPGRYAQEIGRFALPQYRAVERGVGALRGTSATGGEVPTTANALLQGLFGVKVSGGIGENSAERQVRRGKEAMQRTGGQVPDYGRAYAERISRELQRNAAWSPNAEFTRRAAEMNDADDIGQQLQNVQSEIRNALSGTRYTEAERRVALPRLMDWALVLGQRRAKLMRSQMQQLQPGALPNDYWSR